jgi:hypothetical protein
MEIVMNNDAPGSLHAGDPIDDLCRACKMVRSHTVIVVDSAGNALRVQCDYCGSQHNFRGGESKEIPVRPQSGHSGDSAIPAVTERERSMPVVSLSADNGGTADLELLLRRIIREEMGLTPVALSEKWRGGDMILRPGKTGLQEKSWPIETFFHKIVMLRNRLRVLEQQVNSSEIPEDEKIKLQSYITGCYGTLTSFNILFADEEDRFRGSSE